MDDPSEEIPPGIEDIVDSRGSLSPRPAETSLETPAVGQTVGDYLLLDQVGAGGFSVVWRARHRASGEIVALKLPRDPALISHLTREALVSARFQDPQVVEILEARLDSHPPYLVSPFVPGADLRLPDQAPPPERQVEVFRQFRKLAEVIDRLHRAGIVHGDLKPGNIRFDPAGVCHVLDLGLARLQVGVRQVSTLRASIVSVTGEKIAGTLEFMAPEVMSGSTPDKGSDVYALGVILHSMLCGRPPAFGVSPNELNPYLPPGATDFLRQMLAFEPDRRLPDAGSLLGVVDHFIRAEERCLRRRNGHARRRVFQERMRTLFRGIKGLGLGAAAILLVFFGWGSLKSLGETSRGQILVLIPLFVIPLSSVGFLLGVTTINAWILGIPERTYKNRRGHPWWTFMMQ